MLFRNSSNNRIKDLDMISQSFISSKKKKKKKDNVAWIVKEKKIIIKIVSIQFNTS